jgi:pimeloyl-ACP methyl ester carboxylesterase
MVQRSRPLWPLYLVLGTPLVGWLLARYVWLARGRLPSPAIHSVLCLPDDLRIATVLLPRGNDHVVIVAHGFLKRKDDRRVLRLASSLLKHADVILYDQPGHGESTGQADLDFDSAGACLAEVARAARQLGYARVSAVGISLGAAAAINAAAAGAPLDAVVSISSPVHPTMNHDEPWKPGVTRYLYQLLGTRLAETIAMRGWPLASVARVAPCPLLVVHCGRDTLVSLSASQGLYRSARHPKAWLLDAQALHGTPNHSHRQIVAWLQASVHQTARTEEQDQ